MSTEHGTDREIYTRFIKKTRITVGNIRRDGDMGWGIDNPINPVGAEGSYDDYFRRILKQEGVDTFQEWLVARKERGLPTHVLDLFGSGYIVDDLDTVDSITGMRVLDTTDEKIERLRGIISSGYIPSLNKKRESAVDRMTRFAESDKWELVLGNLYVPSTWTSLDRSRGSKMYDLVTVKPEGSLTDLSYFHRKDRNNYWEDDKEDVRRVYASGFLHLLDNAYTRTNPEGGMIAASVPLFVGHYYLDRFADIIQSEAGVRASITRADDRTTRDLKIVRTTNSSPNLRDVVTPHFLAA